MTRFFLGVTLGAGLVTLVLSPVASAQTCVGNAQVSGAYAFVGSRVGFTTVSESTGGTGSTGATTTPVYSMTPIGQLLGYVDQASPFAVVGRVVADGAGNLFASPNATSALSLVGVYTVNSDCSISVSFTDVFVGVSITPPGTTGAGSSIGGTTGSSGSTGSTGATTSSTAKPISMTFEGFVSANGAEIDLAQIGSIQTGTTGSGTTTTTTGTTTTTTGATTFAADTGAVITMRRALQFSGCSDASLAGNFGLVSQFNMGATGTTTGTTSSSITPVSWIGRLVANGMGMFVTANLGTAAPIPPLELSGAYNVNPDCTGTAQIIDSTGTTRNIAFVLVQGESTPSLTSPVTVRPELLFTYTDQNVSGFGTAQ